MSKTFHEHIDFAKAQIGISDRDGAAVIAAAILSLADAIRDAAGMLAAAGNIGQAVRTPQPAAAPVPNAPRPEPTPSAQTPPAGTPAPEATKSTPLASGEPALPSDDELRSALVAAVRSGLAGRTAGLALLPKYGVISVDKVEGENRRKILDDLKALVPGHDVK